MKTFESFDELLRFVRGWTSWDDPNSYDAVGILSVLAACLDNLAEMGNEGDVEHIPYVLDSRQIEVLKRLCQHCAGGPKD
ncbi:MAG: hypothetical protein AAFZ74_19115 [Pseudomonadota bacterium]